MYIRGENYNMNEEYEKYLDRMNELVQCGQADTEEILSYQEYVIIYQTFGEREENKNEKHNHSRIF